jgi:uncharacterized protein involved in exopolysaccharide biosynthesis
LAAARDQWKSLNRHDLEINNLQREVELCEADYRRYAETYEQTRIDEALQWEKISNISVLQPATYEVKPVQPRKAITLVLGLLVGSFGGLALALFGDMRERPAAACDEAAPNGKAESNGKKSRPISIPRMKERPLASTNQE